MPISISWRAPSRLAGRQGVAPPRPFPRADVSPQDFAVLTLSAYKAMMAHKSFARPSEDILLQGAKLPHNTPLSFLLLLVRGT